MTRVTRKSEATPTVALSDASRSSTSGDDVWPGSSFAILYSWRSSRDRTDRVIAGVAEISAEALERIR
jgi:hypothetical protein